MKVYRIKDWEQFYENSRTRTMEQMRWIPVPNKHDGGGYIQLVSGRDGAAMLGCWLAVLQVASKCNPRGLLLQGNGKAHDASSIALITRLKVRAIDKFLHKAASSGINWIEVVDMEEIGPLRENPQNNRQNSDFSSNAYQPLDTRLSKTYHAGVTEWKEGNRREENTHKEGGSAATSVCETVPVGTHALQADAARTILAAYPLQQGIRGAHYACEQAILEIRRRGKPDPVQWLMEQIALYSASDKVKRGIIYSPRKFFEDGHYDDEPSSWADKNLEEKSLAEQVMGNVPVNLEPMTEEESEDYKRAGEEWNKARAIRQAELAKQEREGEHAGQH